MVSDGYKLAQFLKYLSCASLMIGKRTIVPWIGWITLFVIRDVFQFQGTMPLEIDRLQRSVTGVAIAKAVLLSIKHQSLDIQVGEQPNDVIVCSCA